MISQARHAQHPPSPDEPALQSRKAERGCSFGRRTRRMTAQKPQAEAVQPSLSMCLSHPLSLSLPPLSLSVCVSVSPPPLSSVCLSMCLSPPPLPLSLFCPHVCLSLSLPPLSLSDEAFFRHLTTAASTRTRRESGLFWSPRSKTFTRIASNAPTCGSNAPSASATAATTPSEANHAWDAMQLDSWGFKGKGV